MFGRMSCLGYNGRRHICQPLRSSFVLLATIVIQLFGYNLLARIPHQVHCLVVVVRPARPNRQQRHQNHRQWWRLHSAITPLPSGLSPFEKAASKRLNLQETFRKLAAKAIDQAVANGERLLEIDFPPFLGVNKNQFDDYDNISELDTNRDWCVQLLPLLNNNNNNNKKCITTTWLVFPDDKECELAATEWTGQRYRSETKKFTSIRAACAAVSTMKSTTASSTTTTKTATTFQKAWGVTLAETINKLQGGDGILADSTKLDSLFTTPAMVNGRRQHRFQLICQPGNGGPVEDWINVEQLCAQKDGDDNDKDDTTIIVTTCIVNGALDKVRDGYYPAIFFPALAKTIPFYKQFTPVLFIKPLTDQGYAGWLFRVYPEPWQVVLQTTNNGNNNNNQQLVVKNTVVLQTKERPSYKDAIRALVTAGMAQKGNIA